MNESSSLIAGASPRKRITSADVREADFATVFRGADRAQLDRFLGNVAGELDLRTEEHQVMTARIAELEATVRQLTPPPAPAEEEGHAEEDEVGRTARSVLMRAQSTADRVLTDAQQQARQIVDSARQHQGSLIGDARSRAQRIIAEAVEEAGRQAASIAAQAPIDARREYAAMLGLAANARAAMRAAFASLEASIAQWERQERDGVIPVPAADATQA